MTLKSEDESTPGSEGWPFLRMHYIKVCDPRASVLFPLPWESEWTPSAHDSCVWCEWMVCVGRKHCIGNSSLHWQPALLVPLWEIIWCYNITIAKKENTELLLRINLKTS